MASATATRTADSSSAIAVGGERFPKKRGLFFRSWGVGRERWVSPLLRRILLVNALPLALLVVALLYLDQYQNGLLEAEVSTLREEAKIYAGALGQAAVHAENPQHLVLVTELARPLLRRLTEPTPNAQAKLYAPDGTLIAESRATEPGAEGVASDSSPPPNRNWLVDAVGWFYDRVLSRLTSTSTGQMLQMSPNAGGLDWQPDVKEELRMDSSNQSREMPPYIRRTVHNRLLVTVAEPVIRDKVTVGIILLTREAREVDASLSAVRVSILALFGLALGLTVIMSWYLSLTIARPILRLAEAAERMREGHGRAGAVPETLLARRDEIGELAHALADSAAALWARMDAIERFAADVAHEIKNPLSSIRSAIETLRRVDEPQRQRRLLNIITEDVQRLDRLISDISDASRIDAELSRTPTEPLDIVPILTTLAEIDEATRNEGDPRLVVEVPPGPLVVQGVADRVVQVLRNLISNARSFSPPNGRITLAAAEKGNMIEITVDDEGPGIPEAQRERVFERFYSERPESERFGQHSGLGLSISRQIVVALRGTISAENRRDASGRVLGARFVVCLPKAQQASGR
ncbi:MAG: stimulus-sensing domain-containing protein [Acidobacteriia bacterium]|nr:stimulus-sensing domain-containing protein [Methyloceanibacter sp.]MBX5471527.1 stimulus-sensing domain-containing protein [Acetobacteraceae bacterium]MCL6491542.1 stimulus-sensing domain-containing protein [Terriglobia bacterium]